MVVTEIICDGFTGYIMCYPNENKKKLVIDTVCSGVGNFITCYPKECVVLDKEKVAIPYEYKKWNLEKAIYVPKEDKIYLQMRYSNLVKVLNV